MQARGSLPGDIFYYVDPPFFDADEGGVSIGQIIYDINGEYANANRQDIGAIADIYPQETVRYRMLDTPGFQELRTNFYEQIDEGFGIIQRELEDAGRVNNDYVRSFVYMSLNEPDPQERSEHARWQVRVAAYKVLLFRAGFEAPRGHLVRFTANKDVRTAVQNHATESLKDPKDGLTLQEAAAWFTAAREANEQSPLTSSGSRQPWVNDTLCNLLDMIVQRGRNNNYISGHRLLAEAVRYHSPRRSGDVAEEIYQSLSEGKIIILDLSVGDPTIRDKVSKQIAAKMFQSSLQHFIDGERPPNIVVYIEEAHNLIGRGMDLTDTWPRLAKEGAKYGIALVYATQEVSSMHPNILANTENWFVTHLNNERKVKELAGFYDFADFSRSLIRAQDVGFARVKMLSGPFVVPVQIDKFDPQAEIDRMASLKEEDLDDIPF
jgi:hypothetical protein